MAVLLDGASRLQAKLVPRESIGGEALYVQDPLDAENNVARSCFAFHQVQQVFRDLCESSPALTLTLPYNSNPCLPPSAPGLPRRARATRGLARSGRARSRSRGAAGARPAWAAAGYAGSALTRANRRRCCCVILNTINFY